MNDDDQSPTADELDDQYRRALRRELLVMAIGLSVVAAGLLILLVLSLDFDPKG